MPLTCHVTAVVGDPFKDAVNCWVPKSGTVTALGDTLTESTGATAVTVTVADADFVLSACDVAVTATCAGFGTAVGAMYRPVLVIVPLEAPPATLHVAAVFELPVMDAVNGCVLPTATVTVAGVIETATVVGGVCDDELPQPHKKTETQLRARHDAQRMNILTEGRVPILKSRESTGAAPRAFTHQIGLPSRLKRCFGVVSTVTGSAHSTGSLHVAPISSDTNFHF